MQAGSDAPAQVVAVALDLGSGTDPRHRADQARADESQLARERRRQIDSSCASAMPAPPRTLQIDRNSEAVVLQHVARAGIGPQVLRCDPARGILVTRYLGATWTEQDAQSDENIDRLARACCVACIRLDVPAGVRAVDLASTVQGYLRTLDERGVHSGLASPSLRERAEAALKLRKGSAACLCHNDVHHLNIVGSDPVQADRLGIRRRRRAAVRSRFGVRLSPLSEAATRAAVVRVRCASDAINWQRLELACWLFDYIRELWIAVR